MAHIRGSVLVNTNYLHTYKNNLQKQLTKIVHYNLSNSLNTRLFTSSAGTGITTPLSDLSFERKDTITALYHIRYAIPEVAAYVCNRNCPIGYRLEFWYL